MALIACRECGSQVSSSASSCPRCGVPAPAPATLVVVLTDAGNDKIKTIRAVREATGLTLQEAKSLVEGGVPKVIIEGVSQDMALAITKTFEGAGAKVEVR